MNSIMYDNPSRENEVFQIHTLGDFSVQYSENNLTDAFENSQKLLELFTYFITYRNELILPEKIIDEIWPEAEFSDPKRTLRALVFRLRKTLSQYENVKGSTVITYTNGCYRFNAREFCEIDIEAFESTFKQAEVLYNKNRSESMILYKQVIKMYRGGYLKKTTSHDWLIPIRNQYHHLFLKSCGKVLDYLSEEGRDQEVVKLSDEIMRLDVFSEHIHFHYVDSLTKLGELVLAKSHVAFVQKIFDRELGITSSDFIKKMNDLINRPTINQLENLELNSSMNLFQESKGPVICTNTFFKLYQTIEVQRSERLCKNLIWGRLTIYMNPSTDLCDEKLPGLMATLRVVLVSNLRKGDVVAQNSDRQFSVSLSTDDLEFAEKVLKRIQKKFDIACASNQVLILTELFQYPNLKTN